MLRRLALDNLLLVLQYAGTSLVPLLLVPHIVREIGLAAYGSLAVALAWASYGVVIVQYSYAYSGPQQIAQLRAGEREGTVFYRVASAKLVLLVLATAMLGMLAAASHLFSAPLSPAQGLVLACLPAAAFLNTGWHLQAAGRFSLLTVASLAGAVVTLMLGFGLVQSWNAHSVTGAALALGVGPLVVGVATFWISSGILAHDGRQLLWQPPWQSLREGWPLFASQFTAVLYSASGPIIVAALAGLEQAGAYGAVERVFTAIAGACLLTHGAAYPRLARLYGTDRRAYLRLLGWVLGVYLALTSIVALVVLVFWDILLGFLFGAQAQGQGSVVLAALVWMSTWVLGVAYTGYLTVSGRSGAVWPLTARILVVALVLGVPGVAFLGAWAWLASLAASQLLVLAAGWRAWRAETGSAIVSAA